MTPELTSFIQQARDLCNDQELVIIDLISARARDRFIPPVNSLASSAGVPTEKVRWLIERLVDQIGSRPFTETTKLSGYHAAPTTPDFAASVSEAVQKRKETMRNSYHKSVAKKRAAKKAEKAAEQASLKSPLTPAERQKAYREREKLLPTTESEQEAKRHANNERQKRWRMKNPEAYREVLRTNRARQREKQRAENGIEREIQSINEELDTLQF